METQDEFRTLSVQVGALQARVEMNSVAIQDNSTHMSDLRAAVGRLESAVDFLRGDIKVLQEQMIAARTTDFRILAGMIIALGLGMGGLMAKGFGWI